MDGKTVDSLRFKGHKLKQLRESLKLTLKEAGERVGFSASYFSDIELGKKDPRHDTVRAICEGFQMMPEFFYIDMPPDYSDMPRGMLSYYDPEEVCFMTDLLSRPYIRLGLAIRLKGIPTHFVWTLVKHWGEREVVQKLPFQIEEETPTEEA